MYEALTDYIEKFDGIDKPGTWIVDKENDASADHPIHMPWVRYDEVVFDFLQALHEYVASHKEPNLYRYDEILEKNGIEWNTNSMKHVDSTQQDGVTILALLVGVSRAERFCDGILLEFLKEGIIQTWLRRLKAIDNAR